MIYNTEPIPYQTSVPLDNRPIFQGNLLTKALGYNDNGSKNTWGKILPFTPIGAGFNSIAGDMYTKHLAAGTAAEDNVNAATGQDIKTALGLLQLGAGVASGNPSMIAGGSTATLGNIVNTTQMKDGGILLGGSHNSGNDLALVHTQTGEDTKVRLEGGEMLFSRKNTDALKEAIKNKDHKRLLKIVKSQMKEGGSPKMADDGDKEMAWGGEVPNAYDYQLNPFGLPQSTKQTFPYSNEYLNGDMPLDYTTNIPNLVAAPKTYSGIPMANAGGANNPNLTFSGDYTWTPPITTGEAPIASIGDMGQYAKYAELLPYLGQTLVGLNASKKSLPNLTEPNSYKNYINSLAALSNQGYTEAEKNLFNLQQQADYAKGVQTARQNAGGNSAALLGALGNIQLAKQEGDLKYAAQDAALRRQNLLNYGSGLGTEAQMFTIPQQQWLMQQAAAARAAGANLANTGMSNMEGFLMNQKAEGDPLRLAMLNYYTKK